MRHFQETVTDCSLLDLLYTRALYIWWNKRVEGQTEKKLYRELVNGDWLHCYPLSSATSDAGGISDHAQCMIRTTGSPNEVMKPF